MSIIKNFIFNRRLKRAVKRAEQLHKLTNRKYLVLRYNNRLIVKSKQDLKYLLKKGIFRANCGIQEIESIALYITN